MQQNAEECRIRSREHVPASQGGLLACAIIFWTLVITMLRSLRQPNFYGQCQWLLDYRFGFMRRGFVGNIVCSLHSITGAPVGKDSLLVYFSLALGLFVGALLVVAYVFLRRRRFDDASVLALLIFSSSPYVMMQGHLIGYLDQLIYCMALVACGLVLRGRPIWAGLVASAALLTHEMFLLLGWPQMLLATLLLWGRGDGRSRPWERILGLALPVLCFLAIMLAQGLMIDKMLLYQQIHHHLAEFRFLPHSDINDMAGWHSTSFFQFLVELGPTTSERLFDPGALLAMGPVTLILLLYAHDAWRIRPYRRLSLLLLAVVFCSLAMQLVAWDTYRIAICPVAAAFLALFVLAQCKPARPVHEGFFLLSLPLLIVNVFTRTPLMDGCIEKFSDPMRLLLYSPTLLLACWILARRASPACGTDSD